MKRVVDFIAAEEPKVRNVKVTCALFNVSRAAYYTNRAGRRTKRVEADNGLRPKIRRVHEASRGTYGAPRVHRQLQSEGEHIGRNRVARLMATEGLQGRHRRRTTRTTIPDPGASGLWVDLVGREFTSGTRPLNQTWAGDITYIRTSQGWAYLATVIDLASRRVVGFAVADHMRSSLIEEAMTMALTSRRPSPGLIFHSDRGSQYTSHSFRELLARHQVRQSVSRPRQCWDNAVAESFFSTIKMELIHRRRFDSVADVRQAVFEYVEVFYNRQRLHSTLGYQSPCAFEASRPNLPPLAPVA